MIDDRLSNILAKLSEAGLFEEENGYLRAIYNEKEHAHILGDDHEYFIDQLHKITPDEPCTGTHDIRLHAVEDEEVEA